MIIVAGSISVDADERDAYLEGCWEVIRAARAADGCLDFHLAADPIELGRINVFERWASAGALEAFRGEGPPPEQEATIRDADVVQYEIAGETPLR